MSLQRKLDQAAEIRHCTESRSSTGEVTLSWGSPTTARCRVHPAKGNGLQSEHARELRCDAVAHFAAGSDVRPGAATGDGLPDKVTVDSVSYLVERVEVSPCGRVVMAWMRRDS